MSTQCIYFLIIISILILPIFKINENFKIIIIFLKKKHQLRKLDWLHKPSDEYGTDVTAIVLSTSAFHPLSLEISLSS